MAEICLDCANKVFKKSDKEYNYLMSDCLELCEECGEYKRVIVRERYFPLLKILFPFID
ncbi:MAG: hypothetical protein J6K88_04450 [Oscillospiraceae bacterium]|nr:hypothetical protein [Oscillospiraceae bacterium]